MTLPIAIALVVVFLLAAILMVPRVLLSRAQDRMAHRTLEEGTQAFQLLTRAEMVTGRFRRVPGLLGLTAEFLSFQGLFGESVRIATSRIAKLETGTRLASGRMLVRLEVLRVTRSGGDAVEFVLSRPAAHAWRSHLGLWAMAERQADADRVTPGKA